MPSTPSRPAALVAGALGVLALCPPLAGGQPASETQTIERLTAWANDPPVPHRARRRLEAHKADSSDKAWLEVETSLDSPSAFSYAVVAEGGPYSVRRRLKQLLEEEQRAWRSGEPQRGALCTSNYDLTVIGSQDHEVRVRMVPRTRGRLLLDGMATLDRGTGDLRRVEGALARPPSFWIKDVRLTRRYERVGSHVLLVRVESVARVRIWGVYHFSMDYDYESVDGVPVARFARR